VEVAEKPRYLDNLPKLQSNEARLARCLTPNYDAAAPMSRADAPDGPGTMRRLRSDAGLRLIEAVGCGITPAALQRIADAFGPLSIIGRKRLFLGVIKALENNWSRRVSINPTASRLAEHFRLIEVQARELSARVRRYETDGSKNPASRGEIQLGVQLARALLGQPTLGKFWIALLNAQALPADGVVVTGEVQGISIGLTHGAALDLVTTMITSLAEGASRAHVEAAAAVKIGRGGARRRGKTLSSDLALDVIRVYLDIRRRYPSSGSGKGYSPRGPLSRFVMAVFDAVRERQPDLRPITDASIGALYYECRKSTSNNH
jgi:hypothetical protein